MLRVDFSERPSALSLPFSVQHAIVADNGTLLGRRLADARQLPLLDDRGRSDLQGLPVPGQQPFAATTVSGGGKYIALAAGEGFTYAITFKAGGQTANANGAAPRTTATVKIPPASAGARRRSS